MVGVCSGVRPLAPLPTPAIINNSSVVGKDDVSIGSSRGNPGVGGLEGVAPTVEVLAVVSVEETMAT